MNAVVWQLLSAVVWLHLGALGSVLKTMQGPLIVGLNPALQKSITFAALTPGAVNRGLTAGDGIGGKGQNVAICASYMGVADTQIAMFLGSGAVGDQVGSLMERATGIPVLTSSMCVRAKAKCRTCISLVDASKLETTEVIEPSDTISESEVQQLLQSVELYYRDNKASGVAVMGSMPPGCPASLYGSILTRCCSRDSRVVLDTVSGLSEALAAVGSVGCQSFVKVNARELCKLAGEAVPGGGDESASVDMHVVHRAAATYGAANPSITYLATTDGPFEATLVNVKSNHMWRYSRPKLPRPVVNPIGAGDAVSAGTLLALTERYTTEFRGGSVSYVGVAEAKQDAEAVDAFRWGLACGAASCLHIENSKVDLADVLSLYRAFVVTSAS